MINKARKIWNKKIYQLLEKNNKMKKRKKTKIFLHLKILLKNKQLEERKKIEFWYSN
jgi:hypothetical protein